MLSLDNTVGVYYTLYRKKQLMKPKICACGCGRIVTDIRLNYCRGHSPKKRARRSDWLGIHRYTVNPKTSCWEWTGPKNKFGYGIVQISNGKSQCAHIAMYNEKVGPVPDGLELDHIVCNNKGCINPEHVIPTTCLANSRRANATVTVEQVKEIKALLGFGFTRTDIAKKLNISYSVIAHIHAGNSWRDV